MRVQGPKPINVISVAKTAVYGEKNTPPLPLWDTRSAAVNGLFPQCNLLSLCKTFFDNTFVFLSTITMFYYLTLLLVPVVYCVMWGWRKSTRLKAVMF